MRGNGRKKPLSERAEQILIFIREYRQRRGVSPSYRDIGKACGIPTTSLVSYWLERLESAGKIRRHRGTPRGIYWVEEADVGQV